MTRQMVDSILELQENNRYSKGIFAWLGYKTKWLEYENVERVAGVTKWSFMKLFNYSIESIIAFSTFPLTISIFVSLLMMFISFIFLILILILKTSFLFNLITVLLFLFGFQLLFLGIIGLYLSKIHIESQDRPKYIVKETNIKE